MFLLFVLPLLIVCGADGQATYLKVDPDCTQPNGSGGTLPCAKVECTSVSGRVYIKNAETCKEAANSLGMTVTTDNFYERTWDGRPPGCYWRSAGELYYNTDFTSTGKRNFEGKSLICLSAPKCIKTIGIETNSATCFCGTTRCTTSSGFYCTASSSTCAAKASAVTVPSPSSSSTPIVNDDSAANKSNSTVEFMVTVIVVLMGMAQLVQST